MNTNEDDYVSLSLKNICRSLRYNVAYYGGGLSITIFDMMFNMFDRVGIAEYGIASRCWPNKGSWLGGSRFCYCCILGEYRPDYFPRFFMLTTKCF